MQLSLLDTAVQSYDGYLITMWQYTRSYTWSKIPDAEGYDYIYISYCESQE